MIHFRRTVQIAPGRQADAVADAHRMQEYWKEIGVDRRVTLVTSGTLGWLCFSSDWDSLAEYEASRAKLQSDSRAIANRDRNLQNDRDGVGPFVPGTSHDEIWRYS